MVCLNDSQAMRKLPNLKQFDRTADLTGDRFFALADLLCHT